MKCQWGGCQTEAVVVLTPLEPFHGAFDYGPGDQRLACRNHMAVLCYPDLITGQSYFLVEPA